MTQVDFSKIENFAGELITINDRKKVDVELMTINKRDRTNLADLIKEGNVNTQDFAITADLIIIKDEGRIVFEEGQSLWVKNKKGYSVELAPRNPVHFEALIQAKIPMGNTVGSPCICKIKLANITFDLFNATGESMGDGRFFYENVPIVFYPGYYTANCVWSPKNT